MSSSEFSVIFIINIDLKHPIMWIFRPLKLSLGRSGRVLKIGLNFSIQQEERYQNDKLFFLEFENSFKNVGQCYSSC